VLLPGIAFVCQNISVQTIVNSTNSYETPNSLMDLISVNWSPSYAYVHPDKSSNANTWQTMLIGAAFLSRFLYRGNKYLKPPEYLMT